MSYSQVQTEGHAHAVTIYVIGMLESLTAARAVSAIGSMHRGARTIRIDLRGVWYIDPNCFVRLARALSTWHNRTGGQITIVFPSHSEISPERRSERPATVLRPRGPSLDVSERPIEAIARLPQLAR